MTQQERDMKATLEINQKTAINGKISVLCPYHKEKTPSCVIDLVRNKFHCLGCGAEGLTTTHDENGHSNTVSVELHPTKEQA